MNIVRRNPFFPATSFFDDFLTRDLFDWSGLASEGSSVPQANILETNNEFQVELAAPGFKKDDFRVELDNDMLTIHTEMQERAYREEASYTRREFGYRSFRRSFHLPNSVQSDKIKARYQDGILRLIIPKKEEARRKPARTISIS